METEISMNISPFVIRDCINIFVGSSELGPVVAITMKKQHSMSTKHSMNTTETNAVQYVLATSPYCY